MVMHPPGHGTVWKCMQTVQLGQRGMEATFSMRRYTQREYSCFVLSLSSACAGLQAATGSQGVKKPRRIVPQVI